MVFDECPFCGSPTRTDIAVCTFCGESITGDAVDPDDYPDSLEFDYVVEQIGRWSNVKHQIVEKYASAHSSMKMQEILATSARKIFQESGYKPK